MTSARAILLLCLAAAGLAAPGCGKKGPPLAPLARAPGRAMDIAARRIGDTVAITFTVPSANMDESKPADIARVEVYAYTAMAQNDVRDTKRMTLVASCAGAQTPGARVRGRRRRSRALRGPPSRARTRAPW